MAEVRLVDIGVNNDIVVEAHLGGECVSFDARVKYIKKGGLIISPIRYDGKVVNLHKSNLNVHVVFDNKRGLPLVWKNCKVQQIIYRNQLQHLITCAANSSNLNRRDNDRVQIGISGKVTGRMGHSFFANVHDISETGFSFVTQHEINNYVNYPLSMSFNDTELNTKFNLRGKVVRKEKLGDNLYLYGCMLSVRVVTLTKYLLQKKNLDRVYDLSKRR